MSSISDFKKRYNSKINHLDLDIILAHSLNKTREFVLTHPEHEIVKSQKSKVIKNIARRMGGEPIAYITGHKEFYGLDFIVDKNTLIPRPETEKLIELTLDEQSKVKSQKSKVLIVDVGTGSGNIIISIVKATKNLKSQISNLKYYAIDISKEALKIARKNAKNHNVNEKIKFIQGNLLDPLIGNWKLEIGNSTMIIVANLPYLSKEIYSSAPIDVKKYEPKSALYSCEAGLAHYHKLLKQIQKISMSYKLKTIKCILEISPEQKQSLTKLIKNILPEAKISFEKDLARKWRICKIDIYS